MIIIIYFYLFITFNSNHPKYQPFSCHGQWTMDYDVQMGGGQEWAEQGLRVGCGWARHRRGPCVAHPQPFRQGQGGPRASRATPARLAWKYLDRKYSFFDQALPRRWAGVAHPWTTRGPPAAHPWPTRGPPVDHPWPTRSPPVDQPLLVEVRRLGREEFRATWMPSPPDRPDFFPSFA